MTATILDFQRGMALLRPSHVLRQTTTRLHNLLVASLARPHHSPPEPRCA